jgi:transcriptional regulator with PAS, ATPase and Fis domain
MIVLALGEVGETTRSIVTRPTPPRRHAAQLVLVLDCDNLLAGPLRFSLAGLEEVVIGRGAARAGVRPLENDPKRAAIRLADAWTSSAHARLVRVAGGGWVLEDAGSKNGVLLDGEKTTRATLRDGQIIELGHTMMLYREAMPAEDEGPFANAPRKVAPLPGLSTLLPTYEHQLANLVGAASAALPIVITGESGTGKELVARAVHALSGRKGPFVAVNCGAIPDNLVETELFGYRKGAFSGATEDRSGLVRASDGGTLFLDEIGDLPAASQAALLRVLQEREVMPVGATRAVSVDVRVVAATHRDLDALVAREKFRGDLLARLSGFSIELPALRDRREDLGLLIPALLERLAPDRKDRTTLAPEAARALIRHDWPYNVRELEKALSSALVVAGNASRIDLDHLPESVRSGQKRIVEEEPASLSPEDHDRRDQIIALLREHQGNVSAVARAMGKARMQLQRWIKRYRIDPAKYSK